MKKLLYLIILFLFTGCDIYKDIGTIAVVESIFIEKNEKYTTYFKIVASDFKNEEKIYKEECMNIATCFNNLNDKLAKKLYLSHMNLLVLNDNLEKKDYSSIFSFFINQNTSRNFFNVISVDKIDEKILSTKVEDINNMTSLSLSSSGISKNMTLYDIVNDILNLSTSYIPHFSTTDDEIEITGYKKIYTGNDILSKNDSLSRNLLHEEIDSFSFTDNNQIYTLNNCTESTKVKKLTVNINIKCEAIGNSNDKILIEEYIKNIMDNYLKNIDNSYLKFLVYKYNNKEIDNPKYEINVKIKINQSEGGDIFE